MTYSPEVAVNQLNQYETVPKEVLSLVLEILHTAVDLSDQAPHLSYFDEELVVQWLTLGGSLTISIDAYDFLDSSDEDEVLSIEVSGIVRNESSTVAVADNLESLIGLMKRYLPGLGRDA